MMISGCGLLPLPFARGARGIGRAFPDPLPQPPPPLPAIAPQPLAVLPTPLESAPPPEFTPSAVFVVLPKGC